MATCRYVVPGRPSCPKQRVHGDFCDDHTRPRPFRWDLMNLVSVVLLLAVLYHRLITVEPTDRFTVCAPLVETLRDPWALGETTDRLYCTPSHLLIKPLPSDAELGHIFVRPIGHSRYLNTLARHACTVPIMSALIVTGGRHVGKTFGLEFMAKHWRDQGCTVFQIDLKPMRLFSNEDAISQSEMFWRFHRRMTAELIIQLTHAVKRLSLSGWELVKLVRCLIPSPIEKPQVDAPIREHTEWKRGQIGNEWYITIDQVMDSMYTTISLPSGREATIIDMAAFIKLMRLLQAMRPSFAPILILLEIDALDTMGELGIAFRVNLLHVCRSAKELTTLVMPIIFETSESQWLKSLWQLHDSRGDSQSFETYEVGMMDREETRLAVVDRHNLITSAQFDELWSRTEGYGSPFTKTLIRHRHKLRQLDDPNLSQAIIETATELVGNQATRCRESLPGHTDPLYQPILEAFSALSTATNWTIQLADVPQGVADALLRMHALDLQDDDDGAILRPSNIATRQGIERWLKDQTPTKAKQ